MRSSASTRGSFTAFVAVAIGLWLPATSEATHFRYGLYASTPTGPMSMEFRLQNGFRRDGYFCLSPTLNTVRCRASDGYPGVGDLFVETIGGTRLMFGDGTSVGSQRGPLMFVVTAIDMAQNWLFALAIDPDSLPAIRTAIPHTYPTTGTFVAYTDSCCRISRIDDGVYSHINNPDGGYRVQATVTVGDGNTPPISALPPIMICPYPATCTFQIPAADSDGDPITFRLATPPEASSFSASTCPTTFCQPGDPGSGSPNPATVSPSGLYSWNTSDATLGPSDTVTLYSTQVVISDSDRNGNTKSSIGLDFLLALVPCPPAGCVPPVFPPPPRGIPPVCYATVPISVGGTLTFSVQAADANVDDAVLLNGIGLPRGAVMTPALPASGNPVTANFTWRPSAADIGTIVINFTATSADGTALCPVTVNVLPNTPPSVRCEAGPNPAARVPAASPSANEDGFYRLIGSDLEDGAVSVFVTNANGTTTFGPFASGTVLKITEAPGTMSFRAPIGGPGSSVVAHVVLDSDALIYAVDSGGLLSPKTVCTVAPPPK